MKFAKTEPYNYIRVPEDICKIKGGSISTNGGNSFQMKFQTEIPNFEDFRPQDMRRFRDELETYIQSQRDLGLLTKGISKIFRSDKYIDRNN